MAKLFDAGLKNTPPAVAAARQHAVRLKRADPRDLRIDYAYGVVLAKQRRYADAIRLLSRYLKQHPDHQPAQRLKLWAQIQHMQYDDVLESLTALEQAFEMPAAGQPPAEHVETARFLGRCFGYLELVRAGAVEEDVLSARKNVLLARLGEIYTPPFDEGRQEVVSRLGQLEADRDARFARADEAEAKRREQAEEALDLNLDNVAAQREVSQSSAEQLREAQREYSLIQGQLTSLQPDRVLLGSQIITFQAQMTDLLDGEENVQIVVPGGEDLVFRFNNGRGSTRRFVTTDEEYFQAMALGIALARLNRRAFEMDRQMLGLRTRMFELAGHGRKEAQTLAESQASAAKAARRADRLKKQLSREEAGNRPRPTMPTGRMALFATYAPLPYEQEKDRVLDWFRQ